MNCVSFSGQYTVTKITPGGPAARSTLLTFPSCDFVESRARSVSIGDILMQVNGRRLDGLGLDMVRSLILGQPGTPCELMLRRLQNGRQEILTRLLL